MMFGKFIARIDKSFRYPPFIRGYMAKHLAIWRSRSEGKMNSHKDDWRKFWIIGSILTVGRRKSFLCDNRSPNICLWCVFIRTRWVMGKRYYWLTIHLKNEKWREMFGKRMFARTWLVWQLQTLKPLPWYVDRVLKIRRWWKKKVVRKLNSEIVVTLKNSRLMKYYGKESELDEE